MDSGSEMPSLAMDLALAVTRLRARLRAEQAAVTTGQSMSQLSLLGRIAEREPVTASELAQAEHVRQQSIAQTVVALRREELVEATPDSSDRRKTLLGLTEQGRHLVDSIVEYRGAWLARAIERHLDVHERETLFTATTIMSRLADYVVEPEEGNHCADSRPAGASFC